MDKLVLVLALSLIVCQFSDATHEEKENEEIQKRFSIKDTLGKISDKLKNNYQSTKQTVKKAFNKVFGSNEDNIEEMLQKRSVTDKIKDGFKSVEKKISNQWDRLFGKPRSSIDSIEDDLKEMKDTFAAKRNGLPGRSSSSSWSFSKTLDSIKRRVSSFFGNDE